MTTDRDWRQWGEKNPYFGVISDKEFLAGQLDEKKLDRFYSGAKPVIDEVIGHIRHLNRGRLSKFKHAVDFGCGVGRLTIPLAEYAQEVDGLDVSADMVRLADEQAKRMNIKNVRFAVSNDKLDNLPARVDLVHSYIVFQHIPPARGLVIADRLLDRLEEGGWAALHFTTHNYQKPGTKAKVAAREKIRPLHKLVNIKNGLPADSPLMRMYMYNPSDLLELFSSRGLREIYCLTSRHGDYGGVMIVGRKSY